MNRLIRYALCVSITTGPIVACSPTQFTTVTIYETPARYVRLEFDRTVKKGMEHSHPISLTPEQVAAVLGGVRIDEPLAKLPVYDDMSVPRVHQAFTDAEIAFLAPLLAQALSQATPEEVVTFYHTRDLSALSREVTSGGVFVQGDELHLILANYRSHTHYKADYGTAETQDDRLTPMQSLAPQRGRLGFVPYSAQRERSSGIWEKLFQYDHRELTILYKQLPPRALTQAGSPP
ncbi:MAG TPA: hypothetical protein VEI50_13130 [Nitrospiraceae bacterium]|nr:hypothetical protein [Nitrospiraceae bacterium]